MRKCCTENEEEEKVKRHCERNDVRSINTNEHQRCLSALSRAMQRPWKQTISVHLSPCGQISVSYQMSTVVFRSVQ